MLLLILLTVLVLSPLLSLSGKAAHWLLVVGCAVGISKYDVNNGVSMTFPEYPK